MTACSGDQAPVRADRVPTQGGEEDAGDEGEASGEEEVDDGVPAERSGQAVETPEIDEAEVENTQIEDANLQAPFKDDAPPRDGAGPKDPAPEQLPPPDNADEVEGLQPADPNTQAGPAQDANLDPEHLEKVRWEAMTDREKRAARARAARKAYEQ